jgi:hypothetical protein
MARRAAHGASLGIASRKGRPQETKTPENDDVDVHLHLRQLAQKNTYVPPFF